MDALSISHGGRITSYLVNILELSLVPVAQNGDDAVLVGTEALAGLPQLWNRLRNQEQLQGNGMLHAYCSPVSSVTVQTEALNGFLPSKVSRSSWQETAPPPLPELNW